ncbi:GPI inositol-deacylase [Lutzomyia longipalpis]|uniref:GPI inositol-deacylase n=1 Tax=Lutzomyia longipalpis TaxID=7200 RepID=UPI002483E85A|nr:GPI inositol-deacylase [Lutzomyia longipalpis]
MFPKIFLVISLLCLCFYLYGFLTLLTNSEKNLCKMTYMYEYPQFVRINFRENKRFPKYNLYGYAEGHLTEFARNGDWNGAPVLFIPGNSGSYKQARSLASVALRKGLDNNWAHHLDYFTVDLNEEYSALFGGVLEEQTEFVGQCIKEILNLYSRLPNRPRSITIVGHSMGGTIAYALLRNTEVAPLIGTIIALSAPLDKPVINFDVFINAFYRSIREKMQESRQVRLIGNHTNTCCANKVSRAPQNLPPKGFDDKLLISIGGGSRDIIVHAGHSDSIYSDIHAMSTSIPLVWLTTDHLCAVWCLQSVLVLNRFLYSTIRPVKGREAYGKGHQFIDDKEEKLAKALHYFTNKSPAEKHHKEVILVSGDKVGEWIEDSRRVFTHQFKNGLNTTRFQMIRLIDLPQYQLLNVEAINLADKDWVFGCAALDVLKTMRYCAKAVSITEYAEKLPSLKHERFHLRLDLKKLKAKHPEWTHVVIGIWPTKQPVQINVDIHAEGDREVKTSIQKWYHYTPQTIIEDTILGSSVYKLSIHGLEESHQAMELVVKPKSCSKPGYHSVAKICVPWTEGFDRYHYFTESSHDSLFLYVPKSKPNGYNSTINPVTVLLHLDPNCRYRVSLRNSFGMTMAMIVQQYSHWLIAHLAAILFLSLKYQISLTPGLEPFKCGSLRSALIKSTPFFIVSASRVFIKVILWTKQLPDPDPYDQSVLISVIIHGSGVALLYILVSGSWAVICFMGEFVHKILLRVIKLPIPSAASLVISSFEKFPLSAIVILLSIATASCGALSLILACFIYFGLITKMYEGYLEEFIFNTAKEIAEKLYGRWRRRTSGAVEGETNPIASTIEGAIENSNVESLENSEASPEQDASGNPEETEPQPVPEAIEANAENVTSAESTTDSQVNSSDTKEDPELNRLLEDSLRQQMKYEEKRKKDEEVLRVEYDAIPEGLSSINFHLCLFFILLLLTFINLPTALTWSKNYPFEKVLSNDPSFIPAIIVILSLAPLWQLSTPRSVHGYRTMGCILYVAAAICILYCQDSLYRINGVICGIFATISIQQTFSTRIQDGLRETINTADRIYLDRVKSFLSGDI